MLGESGFRDKGAEWLLQLVANAMLPSLAPEPLVIGGMMLFHAAMGRIATWRAVTATLFPITLSPASRTMILEQRSA